MTGLSPAVLVAHVGATEPKRWWDPWSAQRRGTCDGCAEDDLVMIVDDGVRLCGPCHEANLEIWRKEDEEDARRELLMDELAFLNGPSLDDRFNSDEDNRVVTVAA